MTQGADDKDNEETTLQDNTEINPEYILREAGGCGRFQIRMAVVVHLIKTIVCFSTYNLIIFSATPKWYCTSRRHLANDTCFEQNGTCNEEKEICHFDNNTKCTAYQFDPEFNTYVGEFQLICEYDFIPNTINSLYIAGICVGNLMGGQLADLIGRKLTFFASLCLLLVFHLVAYFSTMWQMLAAAFCFTGVGCGFFLTVQFTILSEYSLSRWRVVMVGFPSWPLQSSLFALFAYLIHDWRHLQMMTALMVLPAAFAWIVLPESFRWHIAHNRHSKAVNTIESVAEFNKSINTKQVAEKVLLIRNIGDDHKYSFGHLFKTKRLVKMTCLLMVLWGSLDIISNGISFGLQSLSGNIYLNVFFFSLAGIPSKSVAIWLQNRFGRRVAIILSFSIAALTGLTAGIVQMAKVPHRDIVTNVCAFVANAGVAMAWGPLQTMTIEIYPTVIRNISFGFLSVVGSISAIISPQLVYLNSFVPGVLFLVCGVLAVISIVVILFLPETMDRNLQDQIKSDIEINVTAETETYREGIDYKNIEMNAIVE